MGRLQGTLSANATGGPQIPELRNSTRRIETLTYSPIRASEDDIRSGKTRKPTRAWAKASFIQSLGIHTSELTALRLRLQWVRDPIQRDELSTALDAVDSMLDRPSPPRSGTAASAFAAQDSRTLATLGRLLGALRNDLASDVQRRVLAIRDKHIASSNDSQSSIPPIHPTRRLDPPRQPTSDQEPLLTSSLPTIDSSLTWAQAHMPAELLALQEVANKLQPVHPIYSRLAVPLSVADLTTKVRTWAEWTYLATDGFEEHMKVEPIGRLHLERLEVSPAGIENGELVYSLPLAPAETVRLSHKEWSLHNEEFEQIVQDQLENFSETGVVDKTELSRTVTNQNQHSSSLTLSGSGSYGGISASVGYSSKSDNSQVQSDSIKRNMELTRKASSRAKSDHKYSFKISTTTGVEDETIRTITNPRGDAPMRIDYFQMIRKWRVDLFRYDLRMTYDIVIPNPAGDLIRRHVELYDIDQELGRPFQFDLRPYEIDLTTWHLKAAEFGASLDPPPGRTAVETHKEFNSETKFFFDSLELRIDPDYEIESSSFWARFDPDNDDLETDYFDVVDDENDLEAPGERDARGEALLLYRSELLNWNGRSGTVSVIFTGQGLREGSAWWRAVLRPTSDAIKKWQLRSWATLKDAAEEAFFQNRQTLNERKAALKNELASSDSLTLRKMEREEIMKGVVRWLFGPAFDFFPLTIPNRLPGEQGDPAAQDILAPDTLTNKEWAGTLAWGEFIKYIHNAIEWENLVYFTYPYFWSPQERWDMRLSLDHPDPRHRDFLRAGAARVVLPVRRGFAESFLELMEKGAFETLDDDHPYRTIAEEIEAYAKTNYAGLPPANPDGAQGAGDGDENVERGRLIRSWFEYTPTSALQIALDVGLGDLA